MGFDRPGDRAARSWRRRHGTSLPARLLRAWRTRRLVSALRLGSQSCVLDVGCGTGEQLAELAHIVHRGIGIDCAPGMIREARAHLSRSAPTRLEYRVCAIEDASAQELGTFDGVLFIGSLEHMADPALALARAAQLLRPDGRIAVFMPHPRHPRALLHRLQARFGRMPPFRHLTARQLATVAATAGLRRLPSSPGERLHNLLSLIVPGSYLVVLVADPTIRAALTTTP
ncbi:Ubiquinone biosynthesis O-methyltransferase [bacterium HR40]|nr:Ubiquinone biosynthesis O-methyltransferase [bacterium HR40]